MSDGRIDKIKGAVVASVTPATPDFDVDYARFREQIRLIIEGGIQNGSGMVMAAGGGGEGYFLDEEQWRKVVKIFAEEARDKVPTMVGVFDLSTVHAIEKIKYAEDLGIDFIQLAPPHYEKPTDQEVFNHYKMISDAVTKIGIIVYHTYWAFPEYYEVTLPLMTRFADIENVVGVKWGSSNLRNFTDVLFTFRDRFGFIDNQGWVRNVQQAHGMRAFMCFAGNYDPSIAVKLAKLFLAGEYDKYAEESKKASVLREKVRKAMLEEVHGTGVMGEVKTLAEGTLGKATMDVAGRSCGPPFPPQHQLSEEAKARVREEFGLS